MFRILSSTNGLISNSMSSKKKKVRFIDKYFQVLGSYDVPNFDKCYIPSQDSGPSTFAHIVNGNLYYNNYKDGTNDYKPVDTSGDCILCNAGVEYSYGYYIKNSQIHLFKADGTHNLVLEDINADYDKISDRESASGKPLLLRSLTAAGIKNGKVYKLYGTGITEIPELGNNNIKIEGVHNFLLYSEEN